jgi:FkbM family methyltransferase
VALNLQSLARTLYTVVLQPKPARKAANAVLRALVPPEVTVRGVRVALNPNDPVVSGALTLRVYERLETEVLSREIKPGMTVLDVGGNIGYFTALFAKWVGTTGRIHVFEPEPENLIWLRKTIALNGFTNVQIHETAVADYTGKGELFLSEDNSGDHRLTPVAGSRSIAVNVVDLDSFIAGATNLRVDFIKMDIQGAEALALSGMMGLLRANRQIKIFSEFWPEGIRATRISPIDFLSKIADLGFAILNVDESTQQVVQVVNFDRFIQAHPGRKYTNILCYRQP